MPEERGIQVELSRYDLLQHCADYRTIRWALRRVSLWTFGVGLLLILIGIGFTIDRPITPEPITAIIVGVCLIAAAIVNLAWPRPEWLLAEGILLVSIGLFGVSVAGLSRHPGSLVASVALAGFGVQRFLMYYRYRAALANRPPKEILRFLDRLIQEIKDSEPEDSEEFVEFWIGSVWKGKLAGDTAVFVDHAGSKVLIAPKESVKFVPSIEMSRGVLSGPFCECIFQIKDWMIEGTIEPVSLAHYLRWKDEGTEEEEESAGSD